MGYHGLDGWLDMAGESRWSYFLSFCFRVCFRFLKICLG